MSLSFGDEASGDDLIVTAPGIDNMEYGAFAVIARMNGNASTGVHRSLLTLQTSGDNARAQLVLDGDNVAFWNNEPGTAGERESLSSVTVTTDTSELSDHWYIILGEKESGTDTPRLHALLFDNGNWQHGNGDDSQGNWSPFGGAAQVSVSWEGAEQPDARIALWAVWNNRIPWSGDANLESLNLENGVDEWHATNPDFIVILDSLPVVDESGNGGVQHLTSGVFDSTVTPPGFDFAHTLDEKTGAGGLVFGGNAAVEPETAIAHQAGAGGLVFGGNAAVESQTHLLVDKVGAGGLVLGGQADDEFQRFMLVEQLGDGGLVYAGEAGVEIRVETELVDKSGAGGLVLGGAATQEVTLPEVKRVELFYDGQWNNVTSDVYTRDAIRITQGATDAYSSAQPAACRLTFDDRQGTYHPKNPNSSLFGKIGRSTPLRVHVRNNVRFEGEVKSWTPRRAIKGDAWTEVQAHGVTQRLGQGVSPLLSAPERFIRDNNPDAYWPMTDGRLSSAASAQGDADSFDVDAIGFAESAFGAEELALWLGTGLLLRGSAARAGMSMPETGEFAVDVIRAGETADDSDGSRIFIDSDHPAEDGDPQIIWQINFDPGGSLSAPVSSLTILISYIEETSSSVEELGPFIVGIYDGELHHVRLHVVADGTSADWALYLDGELAQSGTEGSTEVQAISRIRILELTGDDSGGVVHGHLSAWSSPPSIADAAAATFGWIGETAGNRIDRLCNEEGVTLVRVGDIDDTVPVGYQYVATFLELVREAARADTAILADPITERGIYYRTGRSLRNQEAALTLDWEAGQVGTPLEPVIDDIEIRNDVTVERPDGGSARAVLESGPLSVTDPPDGAGRYDVSVTVNTPGDGRVLEHQAGWRLHLGTVDEIRFPRVTVDMDASPDLADDVAALRIGDRLDLINLPDDVSVDDVSLIIAGWAEDIGSHRRWVTFNCTPESPYHVPEVGGGAILGTVGSDSATLNGAVTDVETDIDINCGVDGAWVHEGTDYDIVVNGERMIVTAAGAASGTFPDETQTLTVTRSINGVVKTHSDGDAVSMADPVYIGL